MALLFLKKKFNNYSDFSKKEAYIASNGVTGCTLSNYKVYKELLKSEDKTAFIIEDDIILP